MPASGASQPSGGTASGTSHACESEAQLPGIAAPVARGRGGDPRMFAEGSVEEVEGISNPKARSGRTLREFVGTRELFTSSRVSCLLCGGVKEWTRKRGKRSHHKLGAPIS